MSTLFLFALLFLGVAMGSGLRALGQIGHWEGREDEGYRWWYLVQGGILLASTKARQTAA